LEVRVIVVLVVAVYVIDIKLAGVLRYEATEVA
jgi:hypothetical protein